MSTTSTTPATTSTNSVGLTAAEMASYNDLGYVVKRGLFDRAMMARLSDEIDGLHEAQHRAPHPDVHLSWEELPDGRPPRIRQLMHSELVSPIIDHISRSEEILAIMRQLIGPDLVLWHSKLMMKAAHDGTFTPWHQDWGYWVHECLQQTQVNCMLSIDAADLDNGALRFRDGTHHAGAIDHLTFHSDSFNRGLPGGIDDVNSTLIETGPGDAVFFGPLVIHGSGPNASARDRRANTFAYDRPDNLLAHLPPQPARMYRCGVAPLQQKKEQH